MSNQIEVLLSAMENTGTEPADYMARYNAWRSAGPLGAPAVAGLIRLMTHENGEVRRSASKAVEQIVVVAGRPGAERSAVCRALAAQLGEDVPVVVRREVICWLGMLGGSDEAVAVAPLLEHEALREDARLALERIPDPAAVRALENARSRVPKDYRERIEQSLANRGRRGLRRRMIFWK